MQTSDGAVPLFTSVLCPIDFSEHSRVALQFAATIVGRSHGALRVMFVNDPFLVAAAAAAYDDAALGKATTAELKRFLSSTLSPRAARSRSVTYQTALGKPEHEILRAVERDGHDAIVVGTKGLNGAKRLFFGSTTSGLLRRARVPVLAVPAQEAESGERISLPASWPGKAIVAAIELGPRAEADAAAAAKVARWFKATLLLVHVVPVPTKPSWLSADVDAQLRIRCSKAEVAMELLCAGLKDVRARPIVRVGHPPDEIAAIAAEHRSGLIVMMLRGRAGLFGEPAGTCAYQVLCHGVAPVLALSGARGHVLGQSSTPRGRRSPRAGDRRRSDG